MDERQVDQILQNPKFKEMVARKSRLSWTLTAIMLFVYVGFMLLVGYNKELLMTSFSGGVTTLAMPSSYYHLYSAACILILRIRPLIH